MDLMECLRVSTAVFQIQTARMVLIVGTSTVRTLANPASMLRVVHVREDGHAAVVWMTRSSAQRVDGVLTISGVLTFI